MSLNDADMNARIEAHAEPSLPEPPDARFPYRIYMDEVRTGDGGFSPYATLSGGWYGHVPGVDMNFEVYYRVPEDRARWFSRDAAIRFCRSAKYPCHCVPPITVVEVL